MDEQPKRGGMGRGGRVLLYVSLLLNLLIIGLVVGVLSSSGRGAEDRRPPRVGETGLGPLLLALDGQDRRSMGQQMRRALRDSNQTRGEARLRLTEIVSVLQDDASDVADMDPLLSQQFGDTERRLALARDLFLERVSAMSDAERAAYVTRLEAEIARPRGPRGEGRGGPGGD